MLAYLALWPALALLRTINADDPNSLAPWQIAYSHLSPLCSYEPSSAWEISAWGAYATEQGANFSIPAHVGTLNIDGHQSGDAELDITPELPIDGHPSSLTRQSYRFNTSITRGSSPYLFMTNHLAALRYQISIGLPNDVEGQFLNISMMLRNTWVPVAQGDETAPNATLEPALNEDGTTLSDFYTDANDAWTPRNTSSDDELIERGTYLPVPRLNDDSPTSFPNDSILTTNQTDSPLRVAVPPWTQIVQWYGRVGPDQGRYEIRLTNESAISEELLDIHPLTIPANAERPVLADGELLMVAYLDPRVQYDAEIVLVEEGKNLGFEGMVFATVFESEEAANNITAPWNELYNKYRLGYGRSNGLSGGQIAGIVVGSVAVAVIIAGLGFWFWRRKRNSVKPAPVQTGNNKISNGEDVSLETLPR